MTFRHCWHLRISETWNTSPNLLKQSCVIRLKTCVAHIAVAILCGLGLWPLKHRWLAPGVAFASWDSQAWVCHSALRTAEHGSGWQVAPPASRVGWEVNRKRKRWKWSMQLMTLTRFSSVKLFLEWEQHASVFLLYKIREWLTSARSLKV